MKAAPSIATISRRLYSSLTTGAANVWRYSIDAIATSTREADPIVSMRNTSAGITQALIRSASVHHNITGIEDPTRLPTLSKRQLAGRSRRSRRTRSARPQFHGLLTNFAHKLGNRGARVGDHGFCLRFDQLSLAPPLSPLFRKDL